MCLPFFKLTKRKKKSPQEPFLKFNRLTSDFTIQIHEDEEFFPSTPVSAASPSSSAVDFSLALPNPSNTPPQLIRGYPKPLPFYNQQEKEHYIVITTSYRHTNISTKHGCVYLYNVSKNRYVCIPYPSGLKPEYNGHCIDDNSGILYIFFGRYGVFAKLDLYTKKWNVDCLNNDSASQRHKYNVQNMWYPTSYYIPFPVNEIHIFGERVDGNGNGSHFKYDKCTNMFRMCSLSDGTLENDCDLVETKVCYIEHRKQLFVLNGDILGRKTWCLAFNHARKQKWKLLDIDKNSGDCAVLFDRLILIVRGESVWCLDLNSAESELVWLESEFKLNGLLMEDTHMVRVTDFYLHFINLVYANHTQLWFYYLLPSRIQSQFKHIIALGYKKQYSDLSCADSVIDTIGSYLYYH